MNTTNLLGPAPIVPPSVAEQRERPTPRTDAAEIAAPEYVIAEYIHGDFARQLERELAAAWELIHQLQDTIAQQMQGWAQTREELARLRNDIVWQECVYCGGRAPINTTNQCEPCATMSKMAHYEVACPAQREGCIGTIITSPPAPEKGVEG